VNTIGWVAERWHRSFAMACCLATFVGAQRTLLDRLPHDADVSAHSYIGFGSELEPWVLPGEGLVTGFAKVADRCWIARGAQLHCVDWGTRRVLRSQDAPTDLVGLCADQRFLYGVAGRDLHVLDPVAGTSMRTVPIAAAWPPASVTMHRGVLHVVVDQTVMTVDPATGAVKEVTQLGVRAHWIASDGTNVWYGNAGGCRPFLCDGATVPEWAGRTWPWTVVESAAAWVDGRLLLAVECPDGKQREQLAGLLTPTTDIASERLVISLRADDDKLSYDVDAMPIDDGAALGAKLRQLARDRSTLVRAADGKQVRKAVVIEAYSGVKVRDVARVWDLALAAGFTAVHCPPLEGWVRRQQAEEARAPAKK